MTRVLITGGTGFIGSRLALRCVEEGESVRVLAMKNTPAEVENSETLERVGVEVVEGSVTDPGTLARAVEGVEVVYHLAAAQHEANVQDAHFRNVNVEGTRNILEAAVAMGVKRFVHGSTIGVYGDERSGPVTDDTPLEPDNIYGVTKLEGERVVQEFARQVPVAIARISETYGPGDRRLLKLYRAAMGGKLFRIGTGKNLHHLVYIDDLIDGLRLAAVSPDMVEKTFVLAGPEAVSSDEMISEVSRAVGQRPPRLRVPLWPLMFIAAVMEGVLKPLGIQPPLHRRRMNFFIKNFRFDTAAIAAETGYRPKIDFVEGARRTGAWYRDMGLL